MRKIQETKLAENDTSYPASVAAQGVNDNTLRSYEQNRKTICRIVNGNIYRKEGAVARFLLEM